MTDTRNMQETGYVYILTNPSFREDWVKIGKSSRPVNIRSKELDNTAVPLPFEIYATIQSVKYHEIEHLVHKMIDRLTHLRIRQNREFFNVAPHVALDIFRDIANTIDDAEIVEYSNNKPILSAEGELISSFQKPILSGEAKQLSSSTELRSSRERFRFSLIGIEVGELVRFDETGLMVRVVSDNQVEHEGKVYKLCPFVRAFLPLEKRTPSDQYQGSKYFSYNGRVLEDLRKEKEAKESASAKT